MKALRPGSVLWLLAWEARLTWRESLGGITFGGRGRKWGALIGFAVLLAIVQFGAIWFVGLFAAVPRGIMGEVFRDSDIAWVVALLPLVLWTLMLARALNQVAQALYGRGDMALVLSSPILPWRLLAVRIFMIALSCAAGFAVFAMPVLNALLIYGHPRWLAVYPALLALGGLAAAAALVLARALFAMLGPRRTRTAAQVIAAVVPMATFLIPYASNLLSARSLQRIGGGLASVVTAVPGLEALLGLPQRAFAGELVPMLALLGLSGLALAAATRACGGWFRSAAVSFAGAGAGARTRGMTAGILALPFLGGAAAVLRRKEVLLLVRDPWLLSQILLPILSLIPLGVILWRGNWQSGGLVLLGPLLVIFAGQLGGSFAWLALSAEDAPDLVACAPVSPRRVTRAKLEVIASLLALLLAAPLLMFAAQSVWIGAWILLGCTAASAAAIALQLWFPTPGRRRDFHQRHARSTLVSLGETGMSLALGAASSMAAAESAWALLPAACALVLLALLRTASERRRSMLVRTRRRRASLLARLAGAIVALALLAIAVVYSTPLLSWAGQVIDKAAIVFTGDPAGAIIVRASSRAEEALKRGDQGRALELWDEAIGEIRTDRDRARAYNMRGHDLVRAGLRDLAIASHLAAIDLDPASAADAHLAIGRIHLDAKRPEDALAAFHHVSELHPAQAHGPWYEAKALVALDRKAEALDALKRAYKRDPDHEGALYDLGRLYIESNRPENALWAFNKGIALERSWFKVLFFAGRCRAHKDLKRYELAIADCTDALRLAPRSVSALRERGHLHELTGDSGKARADYQHALSIEPGDAWTTVALRRLEYMARHE
jgi:ABC-2 type transport system permease protein